jgi:type I restriction enzyme S subunit
MEGLEASEQKWSALERTHRLDAEYFRREYVECAAHLANMPTARVPDLAKVTDDNHFSISDRFLDEGIPYYRGKDVSGHFFVEECDSTFIDERTFNEKHLVRSHLHKGDILLSIVGTIGELALVSSDIRATCSCKLAILRMKAHAKFLAIFLKSKFGALQIQRNTRGAVQMGFLLEDMDQLRVPVLSDSFMSRIDGLVETARQKTRETSLLYAEAENLLLDELGLKDWHPEDPLSYVAKSSEAFAAARLDAEYFSPSIQQTLDLLHRAGTRVSGISALRRETFTPDARKQFSYIEIGNVCADGTATSEEVWGGEAPSRATWIVHTGDVITSTVRPARRLTAIITPAQDGFVCSSGFAVLRPTRMPAEVLMVYLRLAPVTRLMDLYTTASMYPAISVENILALPCPLHSDEASAKVAEMVRASFNTKQESLALLEKAKRAVEIAIERGEAAASEYLDGKAYLETRALPAMTKQHRYFSLDVLKRYLTEQKLTYMPETVNAYVSQMKREGKIFSAGRGWYSDIAEPLEIDHAPVAELTAEIEKRFPLLDFSCWSTGQLNPYLHHMLGKFVSFVHVDRDAMPSVSDALLDAGYRVFLNPTRREAAKSFMVADKTVVIRPAVAKAPVDGHLARMEKVLVDLHVELETFPLLQPDEFREAAQMLISQRRIELAKLMTYAAQRKVSWRAIFLNPDAVIAGEEPQ